jgi:hypothetical protein
MARNPGNVNINVKIPPAYLGGGIPVGGGSLSGSLSGSVGSSGVHLNGETITLRIGSIPTTSAGTQNPASREQFKIGQGSVGS